MKTAREIHNGNKNRLNLPLHKWLGWSVRLILSGFCWSMYGGRLSPKVSEMPKSISIKEAMGALGGKPGNNDDPDPDQPEKPKPKLKL